MKISPPITVQALRAMKPGDELADGACPGLRARCREKGIIWSLVAKDSDGVKKRWEIAKWPDTGVPQARLMAGEYKAAIKREKAAPALHTLRDILDLYEKEGPALEGKSWATNGRSRITCVFGPILDTPGCELTAEAIQRIADGYHSKANANGAIGAIRPMLKWAAKRGYSPKGIAGELETPSSAVVRQRVLSELELAAILPQLGMTGYDGAARMMLLSLCRREEVCNMRFEDIIEDVWFLPAETRKNGKAHVVPLTQDMITLIGAQGRTSGLVFQTKRGVKLHDWARWQDVVFERTGTSGWHRHDLRRTGATLMGDHGVAPHIVEIALGHSQPHSSLAGVYNKSRYQKEHIEALQVLSDVLSGIEIGARGGKGRGVT